MVPFQYTYVAPVVSTVALGADPSGPMPRSYGPLRLLLAEPWEHERASDPHYCALCTLSRGPGEFRLWQSPGMPAVPMGNQALYTCRTKQGLLVKRTNQL